MNRAHSAGEGDLRWEVKLGTGRRRLARGGGALINGTGGGGTRYILCTIRCFARRV